jgi:hypothetical protein
MNIYKATKKESMTTFCLHSMITSLAPVTEQVAAVVLQLWSSPRAASCHQQDTLEAKKLQAFHRVGVEYEGESSLQFVDITAGRLLRVCRLPFAASKALASPPFLYLASRDSFIHCYRVSQTLEAAAEWRKRVAFLSCLGVFGDWAVAGTLEGDLLYFRGPALEHCLPRLVKGAVEVLQAGAEVLGVAGASGELVLLAGREVVFRQDVTNKRVVDLAWDTSERFLLLALDDGGELAHMVSFITLDRKHDELAREAVLRAVGLKQQGFTVCLGQTPNYFFGVSSEGELSWVAKKKLSQLLVPMSKQSTSSMLKRPGEDRALCCCMVGDRLVWGDVRGNLRVAT